jgi:hypothetical protein
MQQLKDCPALYLDHLDKPTDIPVNQYSVIWHFHITVTCQLNPGKVMN